MSYNTSNYMEQGGAIWNVGGALNILDGGSLTIDDGADALILEQSAGADPANALLMGIGTSADPATTAVADNTFLEFRTESTATSGDSRCLYMRHFLAGAGVSGESLRSSTVLEAAGTNARGTQLSLELATTGSVSGLGVGVDAQIMVGNAAIAANGTYAVVNSEIYSSGASSDMGAVTRLSFLRLANSGNATGTANVDDDANILHLSGFTAGAGHALDSTIDTAAAQIDHTLKVYIDGIGACYIGLMDNADGS